MATEPITEVRPIRILSIDGGGIQGLSCICLLIELCEKISLADGYPELQPPHVLFDVIAGVGTGGWLALLLGRYKLNLFDCAMTYYGIVRAADPNLRRERTAKLSQNRAAISMDGLVAGIDSLMSRRKLGLHLKDREIVGDKFESEDTDGKGRKCYAFALASVYTANASDKQEYHLLRTYDRPDSDSALPGPDPATCKASTAFAMTSAAKDFQRECVRDGVVYWDRNFPDTHNISKIALEEAAALFPQESGKAPPLNFIINVSPGLPTDGDMIALRKAAKNNTTRSYRMKARLLNALSMVGGGDGLKDGINPMLWCGSPSSSQEFSSGRSNTCSSTSSASSRASETDKRLKLAVIDWLEREYGNSDMYYRLKLRTTHETPYLNDVDHSIVSKQLTDDYIALEGTQTKIEKIRKRCIPLPKHELSNDINPDRALVAGHSPAEMETRTMGRSVAFSGYVC